MNNDEGDYARKAVEQSGKRAAVND